MPGMKVIDDLMLFGPNRRSEKTVIELRLQLDEDQCRAVSAAAELLPGRVRGVLAAHDIRLPDDSVLSRAVGADGPAAVCGRLVAGIALALQQHAGHRVAFTKLLPAETAGQCVTLFEYEDDDTGEDARELALHLLGELLPDVALATPLIPDYQGFGQHFGAFERKAAARVLPRDAAAIIEAASRLDVPCVKLERLPYAGLSGSFRVRPNGLLKLGHACRQEVIDGTFCVYRNERLAPLVHDRAAVRRVLAEAGAPLPANDPAHPACVTSRQAVRVAERLGYPVMVKPRSMHRPPAGRVVARRLESAEAVRSAAQEALCVSRGVLVESWVPGETFKIIVLNREVAAVAAVRDGTAVADVTGVAHPSMLKLARRIAVELEAPVMTLTVVTTDIGQPLSGPGAVVNLDIAPALDHLLLGHSPFDGGGLHRLAAEGLVRHLFPEPERSRIPLVAVTGTNGKTTICALISRIMAASGYRTGRAGTTGFFIGNRCIEFDDYSGGSGHHKVLESAEVDFAVLEAARGAASGMGMMFDWCDTAICSNVSRDHLGERGIETVEDMAELKHFIVSRARHAVVLNADDRHSAAMLPRLPGRQAWMVSERDTVETLRARYGPDVACAVTEQVAGAEWVTLYDGDRRLPVVPVDEVPITFQGRVRYNVSNLLQAVAACYRHGAEIETIARELRAFEPDHESNPGRLNFYHGLPFTVLMDYAHNEAGFRNLLDLLGTLEAPRRRVLSFAVVGRMGDDEIRDLAGLLAGSFDLYLCRNYPRLYGREPEEVPALMKQGLLARGVPESHVIETPGDDYVLQALDACRHGDLLVLCASTRNVHREWEQITSYRYDDAS